MILFDKWALVVGAGKSGTAAAALLLRQGRKVILYDGNRDLSPEALRGEVLEECRSHRVELILSHVNEQPMSVLKKSGVLALIGEENICPNIDRALERAAQM